MSFEGKGVIMDYHLFDSKLLAIVYVLTLMV